MLIDDLYKYLLENKENYQILNGWEIGVKEHNHFKIKRYGIYHYEFLIVKGKDAVSADLHFENKKGSEFINKYKEKISELLKEKSFEGEEWGNGEYGRGYRFFSEELNSVDSAINKMIELMETFENFYNGDSEMENQEYIDLLKSSKNLILTGAPGTGKTYKTAEIALKILGKTDVDFSDRKAVMKTYNNAVKAGFIAFTTFHQSMDYEEFVEGLKPNIDEVTKQGTGNYSVKAGIFKRICEQAKTKGSLKSLEEAIEKLKEDSSEKPIKVKNKSGYEFSVTYKGGITFRVRSDKSTAEEGKFHVVNIDLIKQLYQGNEDKIYSKTYVWGILEYLKNKYSIPEYKKDDSEQNYVLIIDEINRGNVSKIFGELITLLEKDKRSGEENAIEVILPYSQEKFSVPNNLYIIGTMNTADRSIGHIDYAIRRRFEFESIKAEKSVIEKYDKYVGNTKELAEKLFDSVETFIKDKINEDLDAEDLMIGHSYFLCQTTEELKRRLQYEIIPLIKEYSKDGIIMVEKTELEVKFEEWKNIIK